MKTIKTYKANVTTKKTIKIPMPKYKAGQSMVINYSNSYSEYEELPHTVTILSGEWDKEYLCWLYRVSDKHSTLIDEKYIDKHIIN